MNSLLRKLGSCLPDSARSRLALLFVVLAISVALPGVVYIDHVYSQRRLLERQASLRDLAQAAAVVLSENLRERQQEVDYLAATAEFRNGPMGSRAVRASLEGLQKSRSYYTWIGFADARGQVRAATGDLLVGVSVAPRPWFRHGLSGRFVGDLHEAVLLAPLLPSSPNGPPRFIDFAAPVIGADGQLRGVLGAHAHWGWAEQVMSAVLPLEAAARGLEVLITGRSGEVLFSSLPGNAGAGQAGHDGFVVATAAVREVTPATPLGWRIVVRQPQEFALRGVVDMRRVLLGSALLSALLFMVLAWRLATLATQPLHQLAILARRIEQGDERTPLDVPTRSREIRELVAALGGMASTLMHRRDALALVNAGLEQRVLERTESLNKLNAELHQLARVDTLTGLANRLAANERMGEEFMRLSRTGRPFSVMVADADHFKRVNDTYGHTVGDEVLKHLAQVLRAHVRKSDFVARMGGEEFLVLLPDTDREGALEVAGKLCQAVRTTPAPAGVPGVTLSIGVAQAHARQADPDEVLREADRWLYHAKESGRDRVSCANQGTIPQ